MAKPQLYEIINKMRLDDGAKCLAKRMVKELDEQAAILYIKELQEKSEALANVLSSIQDSTTK